MYIIKVSIFYTFDNIHSFVKYFIAFNKTLWKYQNAKRVNEKISLLLIPF